MPGRGRPRDHAPPLRAFATATTNIDMQEQTFASELLFVSVFICGYLFLCLFVEMDGCDLHTFYSAGVISFFVLVCVTSANSS